VLELYKPYSAVTREAVLRHMKGETGFANATRPNEGDQTDLRILEPSLDLHQLALPTDGWSGEARQVRGR
jgi:hypothetical protein